MAGIARRRPLIGCLVGCGQVIEMTGFVKADGIVEYPACDIVLDIAWVGHLVVFNVVDARPSILCFVIVDGAASAKGCAIRDRFFVGLDEYLSGLCDDAFAFVEFVFDAT